MSKIRVDFSTMPDHTRPEQYRTRKYVRETSLDGPFEDYDYEWEDELSDLVGLDGWGDHR